MMSLISGIILVSATIHSAQNPANEKLSGNQSVFCLILSLMRWQPSISPVRDFASLDMCNRTWHFICAYSSNTALCIRPDCLSLCNIHPKLWSFAFICHWQRDLQLCTERGETQLNWSGEKSYCLFVKWHVPSRAWSFVMGLIWLHSTVPEPLNLSLSP